MLAILDILQKQFHTRKVNFLTKNAIFGKRLVAWPGQFYLIGQGVAVQCPPSGLDPDLGLIWSSGRAA